MTVPHDEAELLRTRLRWRTLAGTAGPDAFRVALLASFTIDPLVPYLGTRLADAGLPANIMVGPFNQIERQCLDDGSETASFAPHLVVVAPRLEELWAGRPLPLDEPAEDFASDLRYLADACADAARRWAAELVFVLPAVPEIRPAGVGDDGNPHGVLATATHVREALRGHLAGREKVAVLDAETLLRTIGSRAAYRPALLATARIPFSEEYFDLLARRMCRLVRLRRRPAGAPLIVLDGALLTGAPTEPADGDRGRGGDPFLSVESYLAEVGRLGAKVAVCGGIGQKRATVAAWRTAGPDLAAQVREVAAELATGLDRVTFLSPVAEHAEAVGRDLPEVTVLALLEDREHWVRRLDESAAVDQVPDPAGARPAVDAGSVSLESFLAKLRLTVEIEPLPAETAESAADLTVRVAEFHLDGERRPAEWFAGTARECWGVTVRDRFGDYGRCGLVACHADGDVLTVDLWVLTCPVLGKGVEDRVLAWLAGRARELGCGLVRFHYRPTPRNGVFHRFLLDLGAAGAPGREQTGKFEVTIAELTRRAAPPKIPATPAPARAVRLRPRKRPVGTGRFTTAAQILRAIEEQTSRDDPAPVEIGGVGPRTETEHRLAEVFADVLRRPVTDVHRSFFESGGDSMLAVRMIARANQAGLRLTLQQVVKYQSVAALAEVATEADRWEDGGDTVTSAPLLPGQAWFFGLDLPRPNHFNQSLRFELAEDADAGCLERALAALLAHHQSLRMRFHATESGWRQTDPGPPARIPFAHLDLRERPRAEQDAAIAAHETGHQLGMSMADGRLLHVALFSLGTGRPDQLLVMFHHLAIDGLSWRIVLDDLQDAYFQARDTNRVELLTTSMPVLAWARRLNAYAQTDEVRAELPRWLDDTRARIEPLREDIAGAPVAGTAFTDSHVALLDVAETAALRERAVAVDRVSVDVLVLTAITRTLSRWAGRDRFLIDVVNHGREPFLDGTDVSRTVGWLNMNVPVLLETDPDRPLDDAVPETGRQLRLSSSHHGAGDNLLRYLSQDASVRLKLAALPLADILFSYAGTFEPGAAGRALLGPVVEGEGGDMDHAAATPYALQFNSIIVDDRLRLEIFYHGARYHDSTVQKLQADCVSVLRELVENARVPSVAGSRS